MVINLHTVLADVLTVATAAKAAAGVLVHKIWSKLVGAEKKAAAEIAKLEAEAAAAVKKL